MNQYKETTFLIIGGGIAGVSCAETLSYLCPNETIILLTESTLIKAVTKLIPLGKCLTKFHVEEQNHQNMNHQNVHVIVDILKEIHSIQNEIITKSNLIIKYKFLCLCTGGKPNIIQHNNEYIIGIRDTESVIEFQKRIKNSRRIVLLGNGGIASELAYEAKNIQIDWVIKDNHITSTFVEPGAAQFFEQRLHNKNNGTPSPNTKIKRMRYSEEEIVNKSVIQKQTNGAALGPDWHQKIDISGKIENVLDSVKIHYNTEIINIEKTSVNETEENYPLKITLKNAAIIYCDFLVSATGVNPNINFKCDQNFELGQDGGIAVNMMMETNLLNIYAAGDCCYANWNYSEHWFQMRLWTQARQMGTMAGKSMAAKFNNTNILQDFCFELFGHVTTLYGMQVVLLGKYNGQDLGTNYEILLRMTPNLEYIKFILKDGKLRGVILIGDTGLEETCENLILNGIDLTPYGDDILNPNIDIEDYFD